MEKGEEVITCPPRDQPLTRRLPRKYTVKFEILKWK